MRFKEAAAVAAFGAEATASENSNKGCLTGLEKDTVDESKRVICLVPHACTIARIRG